MTCNEVCRQMNRFRNDQMGDRELSDFLNHIKTCPACREELEIQILSEEILFDKDSSEFRKKTSKDDSLLKTNGFIELMNSRKKQEKRNKTELLIEICVALLTIIAMVLIYVL